MATLTACGGSCPTAPPLASPRRIVAQSQRKNPKSRRSKCPAARSYFNLRAAYVAKRVSLPLRSSQAHPSSWPNPHSTRGTAAAHIPRFRALALFGRRPLERVDNPTIPASENLVWGDWCQGESGGAVESFCHVTRLDLRHGCPLPGCAERSSPKAACGAPEARGLTANAQPEPS